MDQTTPEQLQLGEEKKEYTRWLNVLQNYHQERFTKNYQQYTAYTATQSTHAKISDPVAPELVERVVQKLFAHDPRFNVMARGKNIPKELSNIMEAVAGYYWTNPEKIQSSGTLRQKLKVGAREFCIIGNMCVETYYNADSDTPDFRIWPIEDVIFNPSLTLKTSNRYYFRQFISLEYLEAMIEEKNDAGEVVTGLFNADAVRSVKERYKEGIGTMKSDPTPNQVMRSGNNALTRHVEDILMVSVWDTKTLKVRRIIDWTDVVEEVTDPLGIKELPFNFAMDIEVPKEPYGFGILDFLSGVTQAKDLFLNQIVDYGSRALNPPLFVDPSSPAINRQTLRNAFRVGGIVFAKPSDVQHGIYPPLPPEGFELLTYLQQRAEGVSGISPYLGGVPNATTDKTKGTKGGVQALIQQAGSPIQDRQQNIEESIIEPVLNKFLRLAATLMGKDEEKYVYLTGQSAKWVQITKNILLGNVTLKDLVIIKLISDAPLPGPQGGQPPDPNALPPTPVDPQTGQPQIDPKSTYAINSEADQLYQLMVQEGKNPTTHKIFDVDWVVRVETGSMADQDAAQDLQNFQEYVSFRVQYRIPTDFQSISHEMASRMGIKDPEQYDLDPGAPGSTIPFVKPTERINFSDMPPAGQIQMAQNAGIQLSQQDVGGQNPNQPQGQQAESPPSGIPGMGAPAKHPSWG